MDPGNDLPETQETYWRWGVPSLILAGVTLSSMALSFFLVEPSILSRYEAMVVDSQDFEFEPELLASPSVRSIQWFAGMRRATLAAERLMVHSPMEARYRRMHAEVALEIDRTGKQILANISPDASEDRQRCKELVTASKNRALESIRSATRLEGPDAAWAKVWILRDDLLKLRQNCRDDRMRVPSMIDRVGQLSNSLDPADIEEILGGLDVQSAYRASPSLDVAERKTRLESGIARLELSLSRSRPKDASSPGDLTTKAWLVEGLASVDPQRAIREAREAIVEHSQVMQRMSNEWPSEVKIQAIDAFFRCLMVVSGIEEASATVVTRFEAIPPEDQQMLRHIVVASELRALVSKSVFPEGVHGEILSGSVLRSMLRIGSDHPEVRDLLDRYYDGDQAQRPDSLVELLFAEAESAQDTFLMVLDWTKRIMNSQGERGQRQDVSFPVVSERDLEGFVGLLAYWIQKSGSTSVPWEGLGTICESFHRAFPNSLDLKIGSGVLAMRFQKWDIAIGYLDSIGPNSPNRVLIDGLLQEARNRSSMDPSK
jgi:hypothetical protein